jgi:carboxyl-terminal processing protease
VTRFRAPAAAVALVAVAFALVSAQVPDGVETFDAAWTTIRDSHFDRTMNGLDWDAVRAELRPRAAAAKSTGELRGVIRDMLHRLGLSHFALIPSSADAPGAAGDVSADPGFDVRLVNDDLLVTRVNQNVSDVRTGWRVVQIGDTAVADLIHVLPGRRRTPAESATTAGSGHGTEDPAGARGAAVGDSDRLVNVEAWRIAQTRLRGPARSKVDVKFEDGSGTLVTRTLERRPDEGQAVTVGNLPTMFVRVETAKKRTPAGATVGVIGFNVWMAAVDAQFQKAMDELRHADGMVIDLRGNPGGLAAMLMGISGHFVGERKTLGVMKTRDSELRFVANPRLVSATGERVPPFAGPLAILVDAMSGSASECFTGGMQSIGRARVFGQPSMGQALPALFDRLPNGDVLIHAYGDFVTSDGTRLEGRGVIPDEIQPIDRNELLAGHDRPLEAALAWIDRANAARAPQHP